MKKYNGNSLPRLELRLTAAAHYVWEEQDGWWCCFLEHRFGWQHIPEMDKTSIERVTAQIARMLESHKQSAFGRSTT